jgi:hypothetical protein
MMLRSFLIALLLVVAMPAAAREPTAEERAGLLARVSAFETAMRDKNYAAMVDGIPPRMMELIAKNAGATPVQVRAASTQAISAAMAQVEFVSFGMDVNKAELGEGTDGAPYALLPTVTVLSVAGGGKVEARSHTLGVLLDNGWALIRLQEPAQLAVFRQAYPNFASVEIPVGTMRALPND